MKVSFVIFLFFLMVVFYYFFVGVVKSSLVELNEVFLNFICEYVCIFRFKDFVKLDDEFKF